VILAGDFEVSVPFMDETVQIRIHGDASKPALIYLPGLHGDWTLVPGFRLALGGRVRFVEFTYPRTLAWSLEAYADAIEQSLSQHGITRGWLLGESFGSQVAWTLVRRERGGGSGTMEDTGRGRGDGFPPRPLLPAFQADGLILAGGFVKHPFKWGVQLAGTFARGVSLTWLTRLLFVYAKASRWRFRNSPEVVAGIEAFVSRRTELDKLAAVHRLRLIAANDPRPIARQTTMPVHHLAGLWDPVVPWPWVRSGLRRECPGWRGGRLVLFADHNVLGTAPRDAAEQVLAWMCAKSSDFPKSRETSEGGENADAVLECRGYSPTAFVEAGAGTS